jgi:hypothetical protein
LGTPNRLDVFLNIPYDKQFEDLYLAFIAAIATKGLRPRTTLEIPGGARRLDRILALIATCRYSFHDLSRVQMDHRGGSLAPRFNMPFELGLTVAWERTHPGDEYLWFVFESKERRILKSLSDLAGTDVYIHNGTVAGVFREIGNALVRTESQASVQDMRFVYSKLRRSLRSLMKQTGARGAFEAGIFKELVVSATALANVRKRL